MAGYSITQFVSVMILYDIYSNLSDFQFVYIDLFLITTMAALFGFNRAYAGPLAPTPPISALFSILPVFSLLSQLAIAIGVQVRNLKINLVFTCWTGWSSFLHQESVLVCAIRLQECML